MIGGPICDAVEQVVLQDARERHRCCGVLRCLQHKPNVLQRQRHHLVKFRFNGVIRMQDLQIFRFRGIVQRPVQVAEQADVAFVADEFAGDAREIFDYLRCPVG